LLAQGTDLHVKAFSVKSITSGQLCFLLFLIIFLKKELEVCPDRCSVNLDFFQSALWSRILIAAPSALSCRSRRTMVQCKPQPRGISQGKRGAACRIRNSHQKVSWSAASASCCFRRPGERHHACFAVLCCWLFFFFFNISRLHPLGLSKPIDCEVEIFLKKSVERRCARARAEGDCSEAADG